MIDTDIALIENLKSKLIKVNNLLFNHSTTVDALSFWVDYPEIESITVSSVGEYNDDGGYFQSHSLSSIDFTSENAEKSLYKGITGKDYPDEDDYEVSEDDWDELLHIFSHYNLPLLDDEYTTLNRTENPVGDLKEYLRTTYTELINLL